MDNFMGIFRTLTVNCRSVKSLANRDLIYLKCKINKNF